MGVFLAYMKSFAALHYRGSSSQVRVEFERPNVTKFIHELYKHSARKLWQVAYLFKTAGVTTEQQAKNRQEIEQVIYKTIDDVVRSFLPWEVIAKSYFTEPPAEEKPAPPAASKTVIFEDVPEEEESEEEEEQRPRSLSFVEKPEMEDDDKLSVTDLDQKAEVRVPEVDLMTELEGKAEGDGLVLNL
jgi:primosomal protein N'